MLEPVESCRVAKTSVRRKPDRGAEQISELLFGEAAEVLGSEGSWRHVRLQRDNYRGWVSAKSLAAAPIARPDFNSYIITSGSGLVFSRPDIKSPLEERLYFGSTVYGREASGGFIELDCGGFIHGHHISAAPFVESDAVAVALRFAGTPYLWGGRTCDGIDCSALVQTALHACGKVCPRDTGDQRTAFASHAVDGDCQRGDLVYFPGHVGIMVDAANLLHANAFGMTTLVEPLAAVTARLQPSVDQPILAVIRLT